MNNKGQMITIFFSLFLILAIISTLGVESANLNTNENVNSLLQAYNLPKLQYYFFLNALSKVNSITISNNTYNTMYSTLQNVYLRELQNINVSMVLLNTSNIEIRLPRKPENIISYRPVTLFNLQTQSTPSPFQQMINASYTVYENYSNAELSNVEFFYFNGTVIPSWLESHTGQYAVWWIKIGSIPASSSFTVYMGFASKDANLFNNQDIGEAPELSPIYGEYDDGENVFNYYTNFTGPSLPSGWNAFYVNSGATLTVNDGLNLTAYPSGQVLAYFTTSYSTNEVSDAYRSPTSHYGACTLLGWTAGSPVGSIIIKGSETYSLKKGYSGFACAGQTGGIYKDGKSIASPMAFKNAVIANFYWIDGAEVFWQNYTAEISASGKGHPTSSTNSIFLGGDWSNSTYPNQGNVVIYYWVRLRAYPPNGIMPSVGFGSDLP